MIRNGTFKNLFALKKSGKLKNECSAGINTELKSLKESVPSDKAKKYILMAARLAGFNVRDSQTPAPTQAPAKPAPDKKPAAQQKTSGAKTSAQSAKPKATSLSQLETLLLPPGKTAAATSRTAKTARPALSKHEFLRLCRSGNAGEIEAALKNGADANTKDDNGRTALMWAVVFDRAEAEEILLKYGADVNARDDKDRTALMIAASYGHTKPDSKPAANRRAAAVRNDRKEISVTNQNIVNVNVWNVNVNFDEDIFSELASDMVNARDEYGHTILHLAAYNNDAETVEEALNYGADVNARDDEGYTALLYAACFGYSEVAKILLRNGAKVNITYRDPNYSDGVTVFHVARMNRHYETANVILSFGGTDSHPITTAINETVNTVTDFISSIFS